MSMCQSRCQSWGYDVGMEFWHVLGDITILLSVAVLLGILAERIGLSGIVGYLIAGTIVGPGLLDWITSDEAAIHSIAEIGIAGGTGHVFEFTGGAMRALSIEERMTDHMARLMRECDAPSEQYERLGIQSPTEMA